MKTNAFFFSNLFLSCILGLLLCRPYSSHAASLRGPEHDETLLETLVEQVASFQQRIESLEQEREGLLERVNALEELHQEESQSSQQRERRLQNSCIVEDNLEAGRFVINNCNLHVQSGDGRTDTINGKGNIIVGYNELEKESTDRRGSHNVVIGIGHQYKSHSGFVAGRSNCINTPYGSILGGTNNVVDGGCSTISGGHGNAVRGDASHVSGGVFNVAAGHDSAILGGKGNVAQAGEAILGR